MYKPGIRNYLFGICGVVCSLSLTTIGSGLRANAQAATADLSFEVATVKPVDPVYRFDPKHFYAHVNPAGASYWYMTPIFLISYAYGVELFQVTGPEWTNTDHFDIEAKFPEGAGQKDDRRMLQALLKDRFGLTYHIEGRQLEGYVLVVGKHGEKLKPSTSVLVKPETDTPLSGGDSTAGEDRPMPKPTTNKDGSSTIDLGERGTQTIKFDPEHQTMHFEVSKMTMEELASRLKNCLGSGTHKVMDQTGIKGTYQVAYDCPNQMLSLSNPGDAGSLSPDVQQGSASLTRSLDLLGLKLEKRKFLQKVYVIDHIERPSAN